MKKLLAIFAILFIAEFLEAQEISEAQAISIFYKSYIPTSVEVDEKSFIYNGKAITGVQVYVGSNAFNIVASLTDRLKEKLNYRVLSYWKVREDFIDYWFSYEGVVFTIQYEENENLSYITIFSIKDPGGNIN